MNAALATADQAITVHPAEVSGTPAASSIVLVCEHASRFIPPEIGSLGLSDAALDSHIAWDPGAKAVARYMAKHLNAALIAGTVSRLVYDCNRPPEAGDAIPAQSEIYDIPGNLLLTQAERDARAAGIHDRFHAELARVLDMTRDPVLVTIHSFTPIYRGIPRDVDIGILHDDDARLADKLLARAAAHTAQRVERNAPYGPQDGVTHSLRRHGIARDIPNVMLEIRNDLIASDADQRRMADMLCKWLKAALADKAAF